MSDHKILSEKQDGYEAYSDPGASGVICCPRSSVITLSQTTGNNTRTMLPPYYVGQCVRLCLSSITSGKIDITTTAWDGSTGVTFDQSHSVLNFDAAGEAAELVGVPVAGVLRWALLFKDGATAA